MDTIYVTSVDICGNFYLRIHGQKNFDNLKHIDLIILSLLKQSGAIYTNPLLEKLHIGLFCLAKLQNKFVRARVVQLIPTTGNVVVHYIDYGFDKKLLLCDICLTKFPKELEFLDAQAIPYIVCGIRNNEWNSFQLLEISNELLDKNVNVETLLKFAGIECANVFWKNRNLAEYIVNEKGIGGPIGYESMCEEIFKIFKPLGPLKSRNNAIRNTTHCMPVRQLYRSTNVVNHAIEYPVKPVIKDLPSFKQLIQGIQNENIRTPRNILPLSRNMENIPSKPAVATYKSTTWLVGKTYDVECCFVDNGPCSFSVHLKSMKNELLAMMNSLENVEHQHLTEKPTLGMACLSRFSQDNNLYRAIIMNIRNNGCEVSYIDYGNHEFVPYNNIYEIPLSILEKRCYSIRFALSGCKELEPINDNIKNFFKDLVLYKSFKLKVTPLEGPPLIQYCELYNEANENILEILKNYKNRKLSYKPNDTLDKSDIVTVSYIESPKKFFVKRIENQKEFEKMMDELFLYCNKNKTKPTNLTNGTPCAVKFENAWYRAEIVENSADDNNFVTVCHIDFGFIRKCDVNNLNEINEKFVKLPPQAIQCCLKGFESSPENQTADTTITQFEMLAEDSNGDRRLFKTNIFKKLTSNCYLLNLIDDTLKPELNLMKRLFKLNMPFNKYIGMEKDNFKNINSSGENVSEQLVITENGNQQNWEKDSIDSNGSSRSNDNRGLSKQQNRRSLNGFEGNNEIRNSREREYKNYNKNIPPRMQNKRNTQFDSNRHLSTSSSSSNATFEKNGIISDTSGLGSRSTGMNDSDGTKNSAVEKYIPLEQELPNMDITLPAKVDALICWWISPHQFYVQHKNRMQNFEKLMLNIQKFYQHKESTKLTINVGAFIIARYNADKTLYRAKVLAHNNKLRKYKVEFVDFGNSFIINDTDVWQIEERFAQEPIMAKLCSFDNIVANYDHQYISNEIEKYLKPGAPLVCNYISEKGGINFVDIELNGKSLKEQLIQNCLISELQPGIILEMLTGQQIKGQIVTIKDLLNFQILIEGCENKLLCSYNDIKFIKTNSHLSSEFKRDYEGKICVFNIIEVTREKILMVEPIIPMFTKDIPPSLCKYPILSDTINCKYSYLVNSYKYYVRANENADKFYKLLNDMCNYYDKNGDVIIEPKIGYLCATKSSNGKWYRSQIISVLSSNNQDSVEVFLIDCGVIEKILNEQNLKRLDDKFLTISALAIEFYYPINVTGKSSGTNDQCDMHVFNYIKALILNCDLEIRLIDNYENSWIGNIFRENISLKSSLIDEGYVNENDDIDSIKTMISINNKTKYEYKNYDTKEFCNNNIQKMEKPLMTTESENKILKFPQKTLHEAFISHCDNPSRFYLQLTSDFKELEEMQDNIQIVASSLLPLKTYTCGAKCIALYGVDNIWYRAKILDNELMAIQFSDYGNVDVDFDAQNIREMNEAFADIKSFAIPCSLIVAPKDTTDWVDKANQIFLESFDKTVQFEFIDKKQVISYDEKNYINLYIDGVNIADWLCSENLAKKLEYIESGDICYVSHITDLSEFYLQLENDADGLELMAAYLAEFEKFKVIEKSESGKNVGKICAAQFADDEQWYRAKVLAETNDDFEVLFIDFGNTAKTCEIREISKEICEIPYLAKKCLLRMPDMILGWSDSAEKIFAKLSASGEQIFTVNLVKPTSENAIVDLFLDGKNLLEVLEPLCDQKPVNELNISTSTEISDIFKPIMKTALISHINSPLDFYVQTDFEELDRITNFLSAEIDVKNNELKNPSEGDICGAVFPENGILYRAKILSVEPNGANVNYIDYGNCSMATDLRQLPESVLTIDPLATQCCLLADDIDLKSSKVENIFYELVDSIGSENIELKIFNETIHPWIVQIFYNNENINDKIVALVSNNMSKKVVVSHVVSQKEFYIQYETEADKVEKITEILQNLDKLQPVKDGIKQGQIYAAIFPEDQSYYRAKILETNENESQVFFIDFGNTATTTDVCEMPSDIKNLQSLANKCELHHNLSEKYSDEIIEKYFTQLMDSHFGEIFEMEIMEEIDNKNENEMKHWIVKLNVNNGDVSSELEELILKNLNENNNDTFESQTVDNVKKCTVTHCNSPYDFYIQLSNDTQQLDEIAQKLSNADENFSILTEPQINELCAAKFPDDGAYYRAKILKQNPDGFEVLYIDFGNVAITNDLRQLPDELKSLDGYGKQCTLGNSFIELKNYPDKNIIIDSFNNIINTHLNETFQVDVLNSSNNPWLVKLFYQDNNIAEKLSLDISVQQQKSSDETTMWESKCSDAAATTAMWESTMISETNEIINNLISDKNNKLNTTKELARELYNGFQTVLADPNVMQTE